MKVDPLLGKLFRKWSNDIFKSADESSPPEKLALGMF